jgi:opacity protein-like surface antigen
MGSFKSIAVAGALAALSQPAFAGDLPPPTLDLPPAPIAEPVGGDSGLYLRGDIGVGINDLGGLHQTPDLTGVSATTFAWRQEPSLKDSVFVGAGVGYAVNSWFRFDLTGEYRTGASLSAIDSFGVPAVGFPARNQINVYEGHLSSAVGLLNAYVDLGTLCPLGCITPYIGAGVGFSHNMVSGFTDTGTIFLDRTPAAVAQIGGRAYAENASNTTFAWALMAGLGYQVNEKLTLDLGYRYLNLGDGPELEHRRAWNGSTDGVVTKFEDIVSHDIRLGMRWTLDGDCCGAPVEHAPLTRKF